MNSDCISLAPIRPKSLQHLVARSAYVAMMLEVLAWPKPGLVTRHSNGCHRDMTVSTFQASAIACAPYFGRAFQAAYEPALPGGMRLATKLRALGCAAEASMTAATSGRNAHKGFIFLGLIVAAAFGDLKRQDTVPTADAILLRAGKISQSLCRFPATTDRMTAGIKAYWEFGLAGVRGIPGDGFSLVRRYGLPMLRERGWTEDADKVIGDILLNFMARNDDTTILNRKFDIDRISYVKETSAECLSVGGCATRIGMERTLHFDEILSNRNMSPGGSADLVGISLFSYLLENARGAPS